METNVNEDNLEALLKYNKWELYTDRIRQAGIKDIYDLSCSEPNHLISYSIPPLIAKSLINLSKRKYSNHTSSYQPSNQTSNSNVNQSNGDIPSEILDVLSIDIYTLCELSRTSSEEEIDKKWKEGIKKIHPDKNPIIDIKTSQEFLQYFKILRDPDLRKKYNQYYKPKISFDDTFSRDNGLDKLKKKFQKQKIY